MPPKKVWGALALALALGIGTAWLDSRPSWDDTAILVVAIFLATGLLGLILPRWAWLWALAVGIWIPLAGIAHHSYAGVVALFIAFAGAFSGALVHKAVTALDT